MSSYPVITQQSSDKPANVAQTAADLAIRGIAPQPYSHDGIQAPMLLWPKSEKVQSLEEYLARPLRKRAVVVVCDHVSFISYVKAHAEPGTHLFVCTNEKGGEFTAIIDYHEPNNVDETPVDRGAADWGQHVCRYKAEHTPEWVRWLGNSAKPVSQVVMAQFIEDNLVDIEDPEPARMLELVKTLEATQGVDFKSAVRLDNGDRQLHFAHTTTAKAGQQGDMDIPERFSLKLPIFVNGPAYKVACRFRYRISEGSLAMWFEVERPHKLIELALLEAATAIRTELDMPVLNGTASILR